MWEALLPIFEWHNNCWLGTTISNSIWLFPFVETIHILAMAIMFGGMLVINLRLLGIGMKRQPLPLLANTLSPFINWGVVIMLLSGYAMFASGPMKYYSNDGFKVKMAALLAVLIFQYTIYKSTVNKDEQQRSGGLSFAVSLVSFGLWFLVGAAGRAIGFV